MSTKPSWSSELDALFAKRFGHAVPERELLRLAHETLGSRSVLEMEAYLSLLRTLPLDSPVLQELIEHGMNNESYFFRDATTMESLRAHVLPRLIEQASATRVLRVWSAGSSTGEELYSLSILLHELVPDLEQWNLVLLGTDIDTNALEHARKAEYKEWSLRSTSPELRARYFEHDAGSTRYRLRAKYRHNVAFDLHNLADFDAPLPAPGCFDLILCRNVSIYFTEDARAGLHRTLSRALAREGSWLSGASDPKPDLPLHTRVLPGLLEHRHEAAPPPPMAASQPSVLIAPTRRVGDTARPPLRADEPSARKPKPARAAARRIERTAPRAEAPQTATAGEPRELDRARTLADVGDLVGARAIVDRALDANPLSAPAYLLRAILEETDGKPLLAIEALRRALYLEPAFVEAHFRLGMLLERMHDREGAVRALRNAASSRGAAPLRDGLSLQQVAAWYLTTILSEDRHG